jgi:hypothetical protein
MPQVVAISSEFETVIFENRNTGAVSSVGVLALVKNIFINRVSLPVGKFPVGICAAAFFESWFALLVVAD